MLSSATGALFLSILIQNGLYKITVDQILGGGGGACCAPGSATVITSSAVRTIKAGGIPQECLKSKDKVFDTHTLHSCKLLLKVKICLQKLIIGPNLKYRI